MSVHRPRARSAKAAPSAPGITVSSPEGINRIGAQPISPRLTSLDGVTLGILNNSKPNSLRLQERVVALLSPKYTLGGVITKQKLSAAVGADGLDRYAGEVGAVITAIGD
jgi:hypothetical protein